jgi:hypothetical protein
VAAPPPTPPVDTALVSVTASRLPSTLVLDGDLAEWGSLLPTSATTPPPDPAAAPEHPDPKGPPDPDAPLPSGPNPASASSHLALALGNDAVTIAAELGDPARDGIWLGIGSLPPSVPPIGLKARGGWTLAFDCDFEQVYAFEEGFVKGKANPPEVVAACHALLARHEALVAQHRARFTRFFKLDRDGVHAAAADGTLSSIAGAKAVFKPGPHGATVEVTLPIAALPRLVEAPLLTLRLVARAVTGPRPEVLPPQWVSVHLPEPLTIEPFGDLRNHSFQRLVGHVDQVPGLSYQPGDPLHVESMHYTSPRDRSSVVAREEALSGKSLARLGNREIAYVPAYRAWLALLEKGKLVKECKRPLEEGESEDWAPPVDAFPEPERHGAVNRGGEVHVFEYGEMAIAPSGLIRDPSWSVIAIAADGGVRNPVEDAHVPMMYGVETTGFISPDHASFGVRGPTQNLERGKGKPEMVQLEVTWRWDPVKKKYVGKHRRSPLPPPPKPAVSSGHVK